MAAAYLLLFLEIPSGCPLAKEMNELLSWVLPYKSTAVTSLGCLNRFVAACWIANLLPLHLRFVPCVSKGPGRSSSVLHSTLSHRHFASTSQTVTVVWEYHIK